MKFAKWLACVLILALLVAGCKKKDENSAEAPAASPSTPPANAAPSGGPAATGSPNAPEAPLAAAAPHGNDPSLLKPAKLAETAPATYKVRFDTTRGAFSVTVTRSWAPIGADRFYNLVKHHFYDNASFFRVVPGFVVQFGISSYPAVSKSWKSTEIKDDPVTQSNKKGYLTFATAGPNTRTTQIFINLKDNERLDSSGFAPFGAVDAPGMNVVEMLYDVYGDQGGPAQDQIEKQGEPYLKKGWPKLDYIKTATLVQ